MSFLKQFAETTENVKMYSHVPTDEFRCNLSIENFRTTHRTCRYVKIPSIIFRFSNVGSVTKFRNLRSTNLRPITCVMTYSIGYRTSLYAALHKPLRCMIPSMVSWNTISGKDFLYSLCFSPLTLNYTGSHIPNTVDIASVNIYIYTQRERENIKTECVNIRNSTRMCLHENEHEYVSLKSVTLNIDIWNLSVSFVICSFLVYIPYNVQLEFYISISQPARI